MSHSSLERASTIGSFDVADLKKARKKGSARVPHALISSTVMVIVIVIVMALCS
jgi:hypothetical protein